MEEFVKGAVYGAAIGDALGGPIEYMEREKIKKEYGVLKEMVGGGRMQLQPGEFTDDTHLLLEVANGILFNPMYPIEEIGRRFLMWYRQRPQYVGYTTALSFENYLRVGNWKEAARLTARDINKMDSNGGLMRTLPVTFGYMSKPRLMAYWSKEIASMTHYSDEGSTCCIFYNYLVLLSATSGIPKREVVTRAIEFTSEQCKYLDLHPNSFFWYMIRCIQPGAKEILPRGNALDTLGAAVQCFLNRDNFEDALVCAVNRGEDTDTAGTIVGGLTGAYYGYSSIPERWVRELKEKEKLDEVIDGFLKVIRSDKESEGNTK